MDLHVWTNDIDAATELISNQAASEVANSNAQNIGSYGDVSAVTVNSIDPHSIFSIYEHFETVFVWEGFTFTFCREHQWGPRHSHSCSSF